MKILIVDDSLFFRQQLKDILGTLGFDQITEAEDGRMALKLLSRETFGLVFLDWEMPNVNGIQVLNVIRSDQVINDVPVIMVTSHSSKKNIINAVKAGVNNYIVKPITIQTVLAKLKEIGALKEGKG